MTRTTLRVVTFSILACAKYVPNAAGSILQKARGRYWKKAAWYVHSCLVYKKFITRRDDCERALDATERGQRGPYRVAWFFKKVHVAWWSRKSFWRYTGPILTQCWTSNKLFLLQNFSNYAFSAVLVVK